MLEVGAESVTDNRRMLEFLECVRPDSRQRGCFKLLAVAFNLGAGIDLVGDAVGRTGKDGGDYQIGIGVGAGNAVLDAGARTHLIGNCARPPCGC